MNKVIVQINTEDENVLNATSLFMSSGVRLFSLCYSVDVYSEMNGIGITLRTRQKAYEIYNLKYIEEHSYDANVVSKKGLRFAFKCIWPSSHNSISQKVYIKPAIDFLGSGLISGSQIEVYDFENGAGGLLAKWKIRKQDPPPFERLKLDISRNGTTPIKAAQTIIDLINGITKERFNEKIERDLFEVGRENMSASTGVHLFMYLADALHHAVSQNNGDVDEYDAARIYGESLSKAIESGLADDNFMHEVMDIMQRCFISDRKTIDQCCELICLSRNTTLWNLLKESRVFTHRFEVTCKSKVLIEKAEYAVDIEDFLGKQWKTLGLAKNMSTQEIESMITGERIRRKTADSPVLSAGSRKIRV